MTLDLESRVTVISWVSLGIEGTIDLQRLPSTIFCFYISLNQFYGSLNLRGLPDRLEIMSVEGNSLEGTVDLTELPPRMRFLDLSANNFQGVTDFSKLPKAMTLLSVCHTHLEEEIRNEKEKRFLVEGSKVKLIEDDMFDEKMCSPFLEMIKS